MMPIRMRIPRTVKMIVISPTVRPRFTTCCCAAFVGDWLGVGVAVGVCNAVGVGVWDTGDQRGVGVDSIVA